MNLPSHSGLYSITYIKYAKPNGKWVTALAAIRTTATSKTLLLQWVRQFKRQPHCTLYTINFHHHIVFLQLSSSPQLLPEARFWLPLFRGCKSEPYATPITTADLNLCTTQLEQYICLVLLWGVEAQLLCMYTTLHSNTLHTTGRGAASQCSRLLQYAVSNIVQIGTFIVS